MLNAVVFDAYGTLFDVHSVVQKCEECFPGKGSQISSLWRQKQLEYTWLRSLMGKYKDFWQVSADALDYALQELHLAYDTDTVYDILNQYLHLELFPEVQEALNSFKPRELAILSNGSPKMLAELVRNTGLDGTFSQVISVDVLRIYKPRPEVYQLAVEKLGIPKEEILFISANGWDVAGASSYGLNVGWLNRQQKPMDNLSYQPGYTASDLLELVSLTKDL
jgi:2-haloacid dehalogenase